MCDKAPAVEPGNVQFVFNGDSVAEALAQMREVIQAFEHAERAKTPRKTAGR